jgi:hypothetical protein
VFRINSFQLIVCVLLCTLLSTQLLAAEWSGYVAGEYRTFTQSPIDSQQQENSNLSFAAEPEFYHSWNDDKDSLLFTTFFRWDEHDEERTHVDIRELVWTHVADEWELKLGVGKVFWGVTESQHLVDIINQTDLVENIDGEDKLGQPMVNFTLIKDWGVVDLFVLPGFRERTFAGNSGRFRSIPVVDEHAEYESGAKEKLIDLAVRWTQTFDDWDVGVSHFYGTSREPRLIPTLSPGGIVLSPFYDVINQTGLDVQATLDEWLWKLEVIHRSGQGETFNALTGGFEYTFVGVTDSGADLGVILEYLYDDRDDSALVAFDNDLFVGARLAMNDAESSELLFGIISDIKTNARFYSIEASRRIGDSWVLGVEGRFISNIGNNKPLSTVRRDDVIQLELARHF